MVYTFNKQADIELEAAELMKRTSGSTLDAEDALPTFTTVETIQQPVYDIAYN